MILKLQRTDGVGDVLDCIADRVGEVIHGVDAPLVSRSGMGCILDPVKGRVPHVDVGACHVDLGPESICAFGILSVFHFHKEAEVLLDGSVTVRGVLSGLGKGSSVFLHFLS